MIRYWIGRLWCLIGAHRWWRNDGYDFGTLITPERNETERCVCVRPGCKAVHLSTKDRAEAVKIKFEVIEGVGMSDGSLSMVELRLLPPPCRELDRLFDEIAEAAELKENA